MFGKYFYNQRVRMSVAVFGAMFNDLYIIRKEGKKVVSQMKVPLAYAPQRKFLQRIAEMNAAGDRDVENQLAIKLPRMSFEIISMAYDPQRQLPKTNYFTKTAFDSDRSGAKFYTSVPYTISFELNVYAKHHDDALQIVEQILPYFNPQYTVNVKPMEDYPTIVEDVPVILNGVAFTDSFEGNLEDRRTVIYTLTFDMKMSFYGPKPDAGKIITQIDVDYFDTWVGEEYLETSRAKTNPRPVSPDSDYTIITQVIDSDGDNPLPHPH
jgi:hypothetical protein